jgi:hypothetical protein
MQVARLVFIIMMALAYVPSSHAVTERRIRHHKKHRRDDHSSNAPLPSLTELLAKSAELTKAFQRNAEELRDKVRETEDAEAADYQRGGSSFVQLESTKKAEPGVGLRAMEAVTEKIMQFTEKMRKMGNEVSLFTN